jgi:hypothetical protein
MTRDNLPGEEWRPLVGFEGRYDISNKGRVWSVARPHPAVKTGRIVAGAKDPKGYIQVTLGSRTFRVSRLVLETFVGPPGDDQHHAAHNNGDRADNRLENLRWASRKENAADKKLHGTYWIGTSHKAAKLTAEHVAEIRTLRRQGWRWEELSQRFSVSVMTACAAGTGRTYSDLNDTYPPVPRGRRYNRSAA